MTTSVQDAWERISRLLARIAPQALALLNPPADEASLRSVATRVEHPLPGELATSLRTHNGETIPNGLLAGWRLLSTEEIGAENARWRALATKEPSMMDRDESIRATPGVKPVWWSTDWIPIAENASQRRRHRNPTARRASASSFNGAAASQRRRPAARRRPARGPIARGYGAHFGLGLLVALSNSVM
jgi:hypothetical protein